MKQTYLFLSPLIFIISFSFVSAQEVTYSVKYKDLFGKWLYDYHNSKDDVLAYEKIQEHSFRYGNYLEFKANKDLIVGKSAQCGNDQSIFRNYGTWRIDYNTNILYTSVAILKSGKRFKVIKITPKMLWLKKI